MREEKRQLSNSPSSQKGRRYSGSRNERQKATRARFGALVAAALIGIGAVTPTVISNMANQINYRKDAKEAIEWVNKEASFLAEIEKQMDMQTKEDKQQVEDLQALTQAIIKYKELGHKSHRAVEEEQEYIEACKKICDSKNLVIDTYEDVIAANVAQAYGITNPKGITISDFIDSENEHSPSIKLPNGESIVLKDIFTSSKGTMNKETGKIIKDARHLIDVDATYDQREVKDLPIDDIVDTFERATTLGEDYKFSVNEKGQLVVEKVEKDKTPDKDTQTNTPVKDDDQER